MIKEQTYRDAVEQEFAERQLEKPLDALIDDAFEPHERRGVKSILAKIMPMVIREARLDLVDAEEMAEKVFGVNVSRAMHRTIEKASMELYARCLEVMAASMRKAVSMSDEIYAAADAGIAKAKAAEQGDDAPMID